MMIRRFSYQCQRLMLCFKKWAKYGNPKSSWFSLFLMGVFQKEVGSSVLRSTPVFSPCVISISSTEKYVFLRTGLWS